MEESMIQNILNSLVGSRVVKKTIAGNSIAIWLPYEPKHQNAKSLWLDSPWRLEVNGEIETTSADLPWEKEESESIAEYKVRLGIACALSDPLEGSVLESAIMNQKTSDLCLTFNNGRQLRTFVVWRSDENWHLSDYEKNERYGVSVAGVKLEPLIA